jgi:tetratricopeptide (TPR) repeat protein
VEDVQAVVLEAACIPYGEGISFLPLRELAERAVELDDGAPRLGELSSADAALAAARALLEHFTGSGPVVVVLDDVHWAVPTFLDLVEYVVRAVDGPLLVVSATRTELLERRPAWGERATALEPLGGDDPRNLIDALPERDSLDEALASAILEAAEGVPLFLEQLAAHAAESDLAADGIPPTLDALLASRIDALEPGERSVLARAAVVGRAFSRTSIGALTPEHETRELGGRLASLERRRLVRPSGAAHEFVHALVRGAAYAAIGRVERAGMHEHFARWLEGRDQGDELVGTHLERAALDTTSGLERDVRSREASTRLGRAGRRALLAFDHAAAANLLERAAALLERDDPERLELDCGLGHALKGSGEPERAVDLLEDVVERARSTGQRRLELRAAVELVLPRLHDGTLAADAAADLLDGAVDLFGDEADWFGVARAELTYRALLGDWGGRVDLATPHLARAEESFGRLGAVGHTDVAVVADACRGATTVGDAIRLCESCLARQPDHLRAQAYLHCYLAFLRALDADLEGARNVAATARRELEELGEEAGLRTSAALYLGSIEALAGDWRRAQSVFEPGLEYTRDRPAQMAWHAYFLARLGEAALGRGDLESAAELVEEARAVAIAGDAETAVWWRRVAARALSAKGHPRKAALLGHEAVAAADATDDLVMRGEARLDLAEVLFRSGSRSQAATVVRDGLELLDRKGALLPAANGRSRFAGLLVESDSGGAAVAAPLEHHS